MLEIPSQTTKEIIVQTPIIQTRTVIHVQESPLGALQSTYEQMDVSTSGTQQSTQAMDVK